MSQVRAKFACQSVKQLEYGSEIEMSAVYSAEGENKAFTDATPSGSFKMLVKKDYPASKLFQPGKHYYLDITEAPLN